MHREDLLRELARTILGRRVEGRPFKVAMDGRCGSGKSTLAEELAALLPGQEVVRVSVDDFHHRREYRYRLGEDSARGYYEDAFDYGAVIEKLLAPLSETVFPVLCWAASLDLNADVPSSAPPIRMGANAILLFDGVFALRRELDSYWDLRILVNTDPETAIARAIARDAGAADPQSIEGKYRVRYEPAWLLYVSLENPQARADIVIDN